MTWQAVFPWTAADRNENFGGEKPSLGKCISVNASQCTIFSATHAECLEYAGQLIHKTVVHSFLDSASSVDSSRGVILVELDADAKGLGSLLLPLRMVNKMPLLLSVTVTTSLYALHIPSSALYCSDQGHQSICGCGRQVEETSARTKTEQKCPGCWVSERNDNPELEGPINEW